MSDAEDGTYEDIENRPTKIMMIENRISVTKQSPTKLGDDSDVEDEEMKPEVIQGNPFAMAEEFTGE